MSKDFRPMPMKVGRQCAQTINLHLHLLNLLPRLGYLLLSFSRGCREFSNCCETAESGGLSVCNFAEAAVTAQRMAVSRSFATRCGMVICK